jgi:hypothetical protein
MIFQILCEPDGKDERVIEKTLAVMEAAIEINMIWLNRYNDDVCYLNCDEIEYEFEFEYDVSDIIDIKTVPVLKMAGRGLCIDFVCLDVAIRRMMGEEADPWVIPGDHPGVFHVQTRVKRDGNWVILDPTKEIVRHGKYLSAPSVCKC